MSPSRCGLALVFREEGKFAEAVSAAREDLAISRRLDGDQSASARGAHVLAWNVHSLKHPRPEGCP
jgi:hypothetical protein